MLNTSEQHNEAEYLKKKSVELIQESVNATPGRLTEINLELTSIKAYFSERLDNILVIKAAKLEKLRDEKGTVASAKISWGASNEGRNEIIIRGIIGRIKDQISVIKQKVQVKRDESFGSY